jgi:hypothetical protein
MKININIRLVNLIGGFLLLLNSGYPLYAQKQNPEYYQEQDIPKVNYRFFGFGLGFNDYGAGLCGEFSIINKLSAFANAGIGGWGWKLGGGLAFYPKGLPYKSSYSIGYSHASGMKNYETTLATVADPNATVLLDLNPVGTINLLYSYNIILGKKHKVVFSGGYAINISGQGWVVKTPGAVLTPTSEQTLKTLQPGGLIVGLKFMFGI